MTHAGSGDAGARPGRCIRGHGRCRLRQVPWSAARWREAWLERHVEGDLLHPPANVQRMSSGLPLSDEHRWGWLDAIGPQIARRRAWRGVVAACSALKRVYRDRLRRFLGTSFIHLDIDRDTAAARVGARKGHFMPASLIDSQFAALELPGPRRNRGDRSMGPVRSTSWSRRLLRRFGSSSSESMSRSAIDGARILSCEFAHGVNHEFARKSFHESQKLMPGTWLGCCDLPRNGGQSPAIRPLSDDGRLAEQGDDERICQYFAIEEAELYRDPTCRGLFRASTDRRQDRGHRVADGPIAARIFAPPRPAIAPGFYQTFFCHPGKS